MIALMSRTTNVAAQCATSCRKHTVPKPVAPAWHEGYLRMLPDIRRQAFSRLRHMRPEARAEAVQEIIADTLVAYVRLVELGKQDLAYPSPLVTYAIARFRAGRRVGGRLNVGDVMSKHCQRRKSVMVERLDRFREGADDWEGLVVEDRHASPADVAATRIDFRAWLKSLVPRNRRIAQTLALGESTAQVARLFNVTAGRVSQLRQELRYSWYGFIGERRPGKVELAGFLA
jgi:hypothetical protein